MSPRVFVEILSRGRRCREFYGGVWSSSVVKSCRFVDIHIPRESKRGGGEEEGGSVESILLVSCSSPRQIHRRRVLSSAVYPPRPRGSSSFSVLGCGRVSFLFASARPFSRIPIDLVRYTSLYLPAGIDLPAGRLVGVPAFTCLSAPVCVCESLFVSVYICIYPPCRGTAFWFDPQARAPDISFFSFFFFLRPWLCSAPTSPSSVV